MENVDHKYHAKVRSIDGRTEINVFADDIPSLFRDIAQVSIQLDGPSPAGAPKGPSNGNGKKPVATARICQFCQSPNVELVHWTDKQSSLSRSEYKCQACEKWQK